MIPIVYVISVILLFLLFTLVEKSKNKLSITKSLLINIVLLFCFNTFICFLLNSINIKLNLANLSIINYVASFFLLLFLLKKSKIQKYYFNLNDVIIHVLVVLVCFIVLYSNFCGIDLNVKYLTNDAGVHFAAAREFYEYSTLTNKIENDVVIGSFQTGAYINCGLLFKVFAPLIGNINLVKVFILFDVFIFALVGLSVYSLVEKYINKTWKIFITAIMIMFFMLGYPLNSLIFGYAYLSLGLLIIITIVSLMQLYSEIYNKKILYIMLFILNFGLIFTYSIFIFVTYFVLFIYMQIVRYKVDKTLFNFKNIIISLIIFGLPVICGVIFFVIPHFIQTSTGNADFFLKVDGYIYRNMWSNFILILIASITILRIKNEDTKIWKIFIISLIIFMIMFLIIINVLKFGTYYYFKFNYILWFLIWYGTLYSFNYDDNKKINIFITIWLTIYVVLAIIFTFNYDKAMEKSNEIKGEDITSAFDIYGINKYVMNEIISEYTNEELDLLQYVKDNIDLKKDNILLIANSRQETWFDGIFNYKNRIDLQSAISPDDIIKWLNKDYKYVLVFYRSRYYKNCTYMINTGRVLIQNDSGYILINE